MSITGRGAVAVLWCISMVCCFGLQVCNLIVLGSWLDGGWMEDHAPLGTWKAVILGLLVGMLVRDELGRSMDD